MREEFVERHRHDFAELVLVEALLTRLFAARCKNGVPAMSGEASEPGLPDQRQVCCDKTRLFDEFSGSGLDDVFIRLDDPARQF
jgi:hypothetical protein